MRWTAVLSLFLVCAGVGFAQVSTDEAMAKLKAKQEARDAERAKTVTITQGQLDDLKAEIASLKAQLASLHETGIPAAAKIEPVRALAVGQTHDQVMDFLRRHPQEYEILADTISTPHIKSQTTIRSVERSGSNAVNSNAGSNVAANQSEEEKSRQQTVVEGDRTETLVLLRKPYESVEVGAHDESNGVSRTRIHDFRKQWTPVEKMSVHIVENRVAGIDRELARAPSAKAAAPDAAPDGRPIRRRRGRG